MNLLNFTENWVNGEVLQGRLMIVIGLIILIGLVMIFRSGNDMLRGAIIPLSLALVILFGYGGFQLTNRPSHVEKVRVQYEQNKQEAVQSEYDKSMKDNDNYTMLKKVWLVLIIICAILLFFITAEYYRGMLMGFILLFLVTLVVDSILHQRLLVYLNHLKRALDIQ